jgi:hypothetical protein
MPKDLARGHVAAGIGDLDEHGDAGDPFHCGNPVRTVRPKKAILLRCQHC